MIPLFEVPAELAMLLSLATATVGAGAASGDIYFPQVEPAAIVAEPLEGPMQFGERAWLKALYENPQVSPGYSSRVFVTTGGRFYVPTDSDRLRILAARNDDVLAARLAGAAAERNAVRLDATLGRPPCVTDLYVAHLIGPDAAIDFLKTVSATPAAPLASSFPVFAEILARIEPGAAELSVGETYRRLAAGLRERPRLIAIGLKPGIGDAPNRLPSWKVKVDVAGVEATPQ